MNSSCKSRLLRRKNAINNEIPYTAGEKVCLHFNYRQLLHVPLKSGSGHNVSTWVKQTVFLRKKCVNFWHLKHSTFFNQVCVILSLKRKCLKALAFWLTGHIKRWQFLSASFLLVNLIKPNVIWHQSWNTSGMSGLFEITGNSIYFEQIFEICTIFITTYEELEIDCMYIWTKLT